MVGPAWGDAYIYKCPAGKYAAGSELTAENSNCSAGFSASTQVVYKVPPTGAACKPCQNVYFKKPKNGNTHTATDGIVIGDKFNFDKKFDDDVSAGSVSKTKKAGFKKPIYLTGTTNPNRYRPAVQKNCYVPGGSTQYEDETGYFTLSGNCYYTGEYSQK